MYADNEPLQRVLEPLSDRELEAAWDGLSRPNDFPIKQGLPAYGLGDLRARVSATVGMYDRTIVLPK